MPRGALLRHRVSVRDTGSQFSWGTFVNESWDPNLHPDTIVKVVASANWEGNPQKKRKLDRDEVVADPYLVLNDPIRDDDVVVDRWSSLLEKVLHFVLCF